jgi:uncharacterized membrane protein (GlpM family)
MKNPKGIKMIEFIGYFIIGGLVVSLTTYYGTKGQGFLAAFISMFPSMTVLIFFLLYRTGGIPSVIDYAKSLVYVVPPWILYICTVAFLCDRIGIWFSLILGVGLYFCVSIFLNQMR